jgi:hypothetical protein
LALAVLVCGLLAGCGGSKDRGKHQDYDRPKATGSK